METWERGSLEFGKQGIFVTGKTWLVLATKVDLHEGILGLGGTGFEQEVV